MEAEVFDSSLESIDLMLSSIQAISVVPWIWTPARSHVLIEINVEGRHIHSELIIEEYAIWYARQRGIDPCSRYKYGDDQPEDGRIRTA